MNQFYNVVPEQSELVYSSVTATTAGTANAILTLGRDRRIILISNNLNTETMITLNGVNYLALPSNTSHSLDLGTNSMSFLKGSIVGVYHRGVAPTTSGRISVTAL